jgi:hypothetical protein
MAAALNIEVGEHAQQGRPDVDALAARKRKQPVEAREKRRSGHGELNATPSNFASA